MGCGEGPGRVIRRRMEASGGFLLRFGATLATALLLGCLQDVPPGFGVECSSDDDCAGELRCLELEDGVLCTEDRCLTMACQTPCTEPEEDRVCGRFRGYCGCNEFGACEYGDCK
ncbi:MAG: hypothetical protein ABIO70_31825 [Pseudomonadota bacterium]